MFCFNHLAATRLYGWGIVSFAAIPYRVVADNNSLHKKKQKTVLGIVSIRSVLRYAVARLRYLILFHFPNVMGSSKSTERCAVSQIVSGNHKNLEKLFPK